jgi:cytochrome c peroxidase
LFEPDLDPAIGMDLARFPAEGKPKPAPTVLVPNPPDGAWEGMTAEDRAVINRIFVNFGKAIAAYMRLLVSRNAPFDQFVAGDESAIDCAAKRGLELFVGKARCVTCHLGPHFSDDAFHNLGVPQVGPHVPVSDDGRFKDIPPLLASPFSSATPYSDDVTTGRLLGLTNPPSPLTLSQFRTPDLRGVALTAPYMHSGQFDTLEQVIEFYDNGGGAPVSGSLDPLLVPLHLTDVEKSDLVAFLRTLTGDSVDPTLAHPVDAGSNPYP